MLLYLQTCWSRFCSILYNLNYGDAFKLHLLSDTSNLTGLPNLPDISNLPDPLNISDKD